ncbi:MAG: hypothetical protein IT378_20500 [Sandaracinaceae bacterium]|nr:hypothetical protein [Sandaracinaceae bacterium]
MKRAAIFLVVLAAAPHARAGPGRALTVPLPEAPAAEPAEPGGGEAGRAEPAERPWVGPQIQLGYSYFRLSDGWGGGDTHAADVGVFFQFEETHVRLAIWGELGGRDYSLGGADILARAMLEAGVQFTELDPLELHASLVGTLGGVVGERFETTVGYVLGGAGVEVGAAVRLVRGLHLGLALSYLWVEMDGAGFDLFLLRLALGL